MATDEMRMSRRWKGPMMATDEMQISHRWTQINSVAENRPESGRKSCKDMEFFNVQPCNRNNQPDLMTALSFICVHLCSSSANFLLFHPWPISLVFIRG